MTVATPTRDPVAFTDRTRRVLEIRRAIIEGTYQVDPAAVATALLREWAANARGPMGTGDRCPAGDHGVDAPLRRPPREGGVRIHV